MNLERGELVARRENFANGGCLAGKHGGDGALKHSGRGAVFGTAAGDRKRQCLLHFSDDDAAQLGIGLDDEPARRRLERKPAAETRFEQDV